MDKFEERKNTIYALICDDLYVPMKVKEIAILLDIPKTSRAELQEVLDALVAEGKVEVSKKGKYAKAQSRTLTGVFESNARGFGFVRVEGEDEDIFIGKDDRGGAIHNDTVQVQITASPQGSPTERRRLSALMRPAKPLALSCLTMRVLPKISLYRWSTLWVRSQDTRLWWN